MKQPFCSSHRKQSFYIFQLFTCMILYDHFSAALRVGLQDAKAEPHLDAQQFLSVHFSFACVHLHIFILIPARVFIFTREVTCLCPEGLGFST